ncbi:hypothetical protein GOP47_0010164 [Adiantum capillus-veneris]|uniref:Uncharacterized protein n=1 Tax=Adiantum capillus-veneris TaxID=13818 RepID=A0A9D4UU90_ADICA|nr:hypothetical protein GOP47_0010164 [Adiantum capillus-veneris]
MGRVSCCPKDKKVLRKGAWIEEKDVKLLATTDGRPSSACLPGLSDARRSAGSDGPITCIRRSNVATSQARRRASSSNFTLCGETTPESAPPLF